MSSRSVRVLLSSFFVLVGFGCAQSGGSTMPSDDGAAGDSSPGATTDAADGGTSPGSGDGAAPDSGSTPPPVADAAADGPRDAAAPSDAGRPGDAAGGGTDGGAGPTPEAGGGTGCITGPPAIQDGFESPSFASTWQITDPFGNPIPAGSAQYSVTLDATHTHGGSAQAVKVHNGGLFGTAPPGPAFYGRVYMWLGSTPGTIPSGGHWGSIIGVGGVDGGQAPAEVRMGGQFGILIDNYSVNDDVVLSDPNFFNDGMDGGTQAVVGKWSCVEFYFGKDSLRNWIENVEIPSLDVTPTTTWAHGMRAPWSPAYTAIRIGYANYNANAIDVWYDDVALDTNRICCP
jgi:hypothetical protein